MRLSPDRSLQRRILITIALIVLLPFGFIYAFVAASNHIFLPLLESLGSGPYYGRFYVTPGLAAALVFGGLGVQLWLGPSTVLRGLGASRVDGNAYPELHASVTRLSKQAGIKPPSVAIATNSAPNAAAVRGPRGASIMLTTGLLETLDDEERDAVIAHEIAHLKNRDATVMTVAWFLPTITFYVAMAAAYLLYGIYRSLGAGGGSTGDDDAAKAIIILAVTAIVTLTISIMFWVASVLVHRILARYREYAADRGSAALTGDPTALASALRKLDDEIADVPDRDLRKLDGGAEALYLTPLEGRAFTDADLVSTDIFPATHPPTEERIDRLQQLAGELA